MSSFKGINTKKYTKAGPVVTPDLLYWKRLGVPALVKEFGAIDYIDFSPVEPHYFAVTSSVRVQIYNPITRLVAKNLSRFQEAAHGGAFRKDGRLLVAGDDQSFVKLFDVSSKNVLRLFKGHTASVRRTFFTQDMIHIASFSDDRSVKLWDIPTEKAINTFSEHTDYIRAGCVSPISPNILMSGGYDNSVKMYDTRANAVTFQVDHGSPVESILFLPTGGIFLSAGGTEIKVWDALAGGKLLAKISQHHKTISCLRLASGGKRLLSGSLDRHVKVYDVATYQVVHNFDFPNSVLSLGVAPNDETLAVGMVDGMVSIQRMEEPESALPVEKPKFTTHVPQYVDEEIAEYAVSKQSKHDRWLRMYEYSKALDSVLVAYVVNKRPQVTVALIQELIRRKGLTRAFAGRSHKSIATIVRFLIRYISDIRFTRVLVDAANCLLDAYEDQFDQFTNELGKMFIDLETKISAEESLTYDFLKVHGALEMVLAGASVAENSTDVFDAIETQQATNDLRPSKMAEKHAVINVN